VKKARRPMRGPEVDHAAFTESLMKILGDPEVHFRNYPTMSPLPPGAPRDALDPLSPQVNAAIYAQKKYK